MSEKLKIEPEKVVKKEWISSLNSEVKDKTDDILSSENIFKTINRLESSQKYNKIIKFIEEKLNLSFSNKIISDLYIILWRCYLYIWEIDKSLDIYKKARDLEKSNYLKASKEILKIYMIFLDTWAYWDNSEIILSTEFAYNTANSDKKNERTPQYEKNISKELEIILNKELINNRENLEDSDFREIEIDFIESFILIWCLLDANDMLKKETSDKKALYLMENSMSNIISLTNITELEKLQELQTIEYYFDNISKTEEIIDEYMDFKKSTKNWNTKYNKYENMDYILYWKLSEETYKETLKISKNIYNNNPELRLLLLSNLFLYNKEILNYKYYKEASILLCEILENTKLEKNIFFEIFNDDINLYLKNDDLFIVWDLYFKVWDNKSALNVYISYYLSNKTDKEVISKTKNFLEELMLDNNTIKEKLWENKATPLYKVWISSNWEMIYENSQNKIDFFWKIQELYYDVIKSEKLKQKEM